tara:strand:+ start:502 stop:642 length:141 start_codon:yes stop_codon:yes gene_type:complete
MGDNTILFLKVIDFIFKDENKGTSFILSSSKCYIYYLTKDLSLFDL